MRAKSHSPPTATALLPWAPYHTLPPAVSHRRKFGPSLHSTISVSHCCCRQFITLAPSVVHRSPTTYYQVPFFDLAIEGEYISVKSPGNLSTLFDVGGIIGGILAGYVSDKLNARATTAASFMYAAIPAMLLYRKYGSISKSSNILLMMLAGLLVNGPYALITTAVSADLGTHSSLKGDSRALATVTSIIDGTGSMGDALGPLLTGFLSLSGWDDVFDMLIAGAFAAFNSLGDF